MLGLPSMIFGTAVAAFHFKNIPQGYAFLNKATSAAEVKVIEALPLVTGGFFFLINGEPSAVKQAYGLVTEDFETDDLIRHVYIDKIHPEILPALYAQNRFAVTDALGCVSCSCPVTALDFAQKILAEPEIHLADFRGFGAEPHFFVVGDKLILEKIWKKMVPTLKKTQDSHFELVINPTSEFLSFFNLSTI